MIESNETIGGETGSMKNEFTLAFNEVLEDKQLPKEVILEAIEAAMVSAYRRSVNASNAQRIEARVDPETGFVEIFAEKEVVEQVQDDRTEVELDVALTYNPEAELGELVVVKVESTPDDFGRVAAQTARQVIQQRIREAERDAQFEFFERQAGEIISGVVQAITGGNVTMGIDMKAEGILPYKEQIPGERFRIHERVRALLAEVKQSSRGPQIILSRSHRNFLRRLLENEVPEIYHGLVEIRSIAREPGQRSKVAVAALKPGVDPVGACVGIRGVRIQAIVRELNDEKIDVIEWNPDPTQYIAKALSPARVSGVFLNEQGRGTKTATVVVPEDQLSLAIGRDGQNARLAAKLTAWRIDIKSLPEAVADVIHKLQNDPEYMVFAEQEAEAIHQCEEILAKKATGRPITPEEYQVLNQLVERVERSVIKQRQKAYDERQEKVEQIGETIRDEAFEIPVEEMEISQRICTLLRENGYETAGDVLLQIRTEPDKILALQGIGPKAMEDIAAALDQLELIVQPVEEAEVEAPEGEAVAAEAVGEAEITPETLAEPVSEVVEPEAIEAVAEVAEVAEEAVEAEPEAELVAEEEAEAAIEAEPEPEPVILEVDEKEIEARSLDEIFEIKPEIFDIETDEEDEDEEDELYRDRKGAPKKKKKKKKKFVEMEYDPDLDVMIVKKKRKSDDEWEDFEV
jgi:transcription termination/antitermination protein NusA